MLLFSSIFIENCTTHFLLLSMYCMCRTDSVEATILFCFFPSRADFLCRTGPDIPQQTSEPLHHRNPDGDAAEILRLALYAQYGTSPSIFVLFHAHSLKSFLLSSWFPKYFILRSVTVFVVDGNLGKVLCMIPRRLSSRGQAD